MPMATDFQPKLNGNTPVGPGLRPPIFLGMMLRSWAIMPGSIRTRVGVPDRSGRSNRMRGGCMTYAAMYGNGATIFTRWTITTNPRLRTPKDQTQGKPKWFAVARGGSAPNGAGQVIATTRILDMPT